jgi:hypothetical protein
VVFFGMAVVIDLIDGPLLKLATSSLLLAACVLGAVARPPRSIAVTAGINGCAIGAGVLVLYRLVGPGL